MFPCTVYKLPFIGDFKSATFDDTLWLSLPAPLLFAHSANLCWRQLGIIFGAVFGLPQRSQGGGSHPTKKAVLIYICGYLNLTIIWLICVDLNLQYQQDTLDTKVAKCVDREAKWSHVSPCGHPSSNMLVPSPWRSHCPLVIKHGNGTSSTNEGFNGKCIYKWWSIHRCAWLPEGMNYMKSPSKIMTTCV